MTKFVGPVRRREYGSGHAYFDANDRKVPGVTTLIKDGVPAPALANWMGKVTAAYAVDNWAELSELPVSERLNRLQKARFEDRDRGAKRGTEVHKLAEKLVVGDEIDVPEELAGHVESYVRFLDDWDVQPVVVEGVVLSTKHGYAGTFDLIADIPPLGKRALADIKTSRSGIFAETALQLAAYRFADTYIDAAGVEQPMMPVDGCYGIHVRADGYDFMPITAGLRQHRQFLYAVQVAEFRATSRDLVGAPLTPPALQEAAS